MTDRSRAERSRRGSRLRPRMRRLRERVRAHSLLNTTWRVGVFTVGWLIVLAGIAMLVLPGPGWAAIFVGFAILATEFVWARRALRRARQVARQATERALDPRVRRRNQAIVTGVVVLAILSVGLYLWRYGMPLHYFG